MSSSPVMQDDNSSVPNGRTAVDTKNTEQQRRTRSCNAFRRAFINPTRPLWWASVFVLSSLLSSTFTRYRDNINRTLTYRSKAGTVTSTQQFQYCNQNRSNAESCIVNTDISCDSTAVNYPAAPTNSKRHIPIPDQVDTNIDFKSQDTVYSSSWHKDNTAVGGATRTYQQFCSDSFNTIVGSKTCVECMPAHLYHGSKTCVECTPAHLYHNKKRSNSNDVLRGLSGWLGAVVATALSSALTTVNQHSFIVTAQAVEDAWTFTFDYGPNGECVCEKASWGEYGSEVECLTAFASSPFERCTYNDKGVEAADCDYAVATDYSSTNADCNALCLEYVVDGTKTYDEFTAHCKFEYYHVQQGCVQIDGCSPCFDTIIHGHSDDSKAILDPSQFE
eukprot:Lankesteria_metandrocarpae@DN5452_c0_g1_i1.p1